MPLDPPVPDPAAGASDDPAGDADRRAVLAANAAYYEAFEARDLEAMSDAWEHGDRVSCTHPGWQTLRGWGAVAGSWFALFQGPQHLQFVLTGSHVEAVGDVAWVTVDENLLDSGGHAPGAGEGDAAVGGTVAALNLFVRGGDGRWRLVAHHGAPVARRG